MSSADLRVAMIGFGLAGAAFHAPLIAAVPRLTMTAVVSRDPGRRDGRIVELDI
jgi:predicted dehydrogenase